MSPIDHARALGCCPFLVDDSLLMSSGARRSFLRGTLNVNPSVRIDRHTALLIQTNREESRMQYPASITPQASSIYLPLLLSSSSLRLST